MPRDTKGRVHSTESFALVDGPGVRFAVFLQGCAMRCQYCHNPETWTHEGEEWTAQALFDRAYRYKHYWRQNGGITVSGGEPLLQIDFVTRFFALAKARGVHTALDTSGQPFTENGSFLSRFEALMAVTDLVLLDLKEMDDAKHRALTGHGNANILAMARWLSDHGKPMWIRHVLVPGLTDSEESLIALRDFVDTLLTVERVEVLPYHNMALPEWQKLGIPYPLEGVPMPSAQEVARAEELLHVDRYPK